MRARFLRLFVDFMRHQLHVAHIKFDCLIGGCRHFDAPTIKWYKSLSPKGDSVNILMPADEPCINKRHFGAQQSSDIPSHKSSRRQILWKRLTLLQTEIKINFITRIANQLYFGIMFYVARSHWFAIRFSLAFTLRLEFSCAFAKRADTIKNAFTATILLGIYQHLHTSKVESRAIFSFARIAFRISNTSFRFLLSSFIETICCLVSHSEWRMSLLGENHSANIVPCILFFFLISCKQWKVRLSTRFWGGFFLRAHTTEIHSFVWDA